MASLHYAATIFRIFLIENGGSKLFILSEKATLAQTS
jgi:hypothetical protein